LNVKYRDVRTPSTPDSFAVCTPVAIEFYRTGKMAPYGLNPMPAWSKDFAGAAGKTGSSGAMLWVSVAVVIVILIGGLYYFRRMSRSSPTSSEQRQSAKAKSQE